MVSKTLQLVAAGTLMFAVPAAAGPAEDAESAFKAFITARRANDQDMLNRLARPEFVQHHAYGLTESRAAWIRTLGAQGAEPSGTQFSERAVEMRIAGQTAVRSSIVRIRRQARKIDTWVRAIVVLVNGDKGWQVMEMDSALLHEGPIADVVAQLPKGRFVSKESGEFRLSEIGLQPFLLWTDGRSLPLIPLAPDKFVAGHGSTLTIDRSSSGEVLSLTRHYGERLAWTARPAP